MTHKEEYNFNLTDVFAILKRVLGAEQSLYGIILVYSVALSLLNLAIPSITQYLIGSVYQTAMINPLLSLGLLTTVILTLYSIFKLSELYAFELFKRKFFSRLTFDITLRVLYSEYNFLESHNKLDYCNRFFDIMLIQRRLPELMLNGLALLQQLVIGLIIISSYNAHFMLLSVASGLLLYIICQVYMMKAINAAIAESYTKYDVGAWIEDVARLHGELKSESNAKFALKKSDNLVNAYLNARIRYFGVIFSQSVLLLILYIAIGSSFFIVGGILVKNGQITLGQMIACEIIIMMILNSLSRASKILDALYDLCSACKKISTFYNIPLENRLGVSNIAELCQVASHSNLPTLDFANCRFFYKKRIYHLNLSFARGSFSLLYVANTNSERIFCEAARKFITASSGIISFAGVDIAEISSIFAREGIALLDSDQLYDTTIAEYLSNNNPNISSSAMHRVLQVVEIEDPTNQDTLDLQTRLLSNGRPLSSLQVIRLKMAKAIIQKPPVLIITQVFDQIRSARRGKILNFIKSEIPDTTLIYFSNRKDFSPSLFDSYIFLGTDYVENFKTLNDLSSFEGRQYAI